MKLQWMVALVGLAAMPVGCTRSGWSGASGGAAPRVSGASRAERSIQRSRSLVEAGKPLEARRALNEALRNEPEPEAAEAGRLREALAALNERLIFSPTVEPGDQHVELYTVQEGDTLERIGRRYHVPWPLLQRINEGVDPRRMRVGTRLKVVKGPIHAEVHKGDFRLDAYVGERAEDRLYLRSFAVGLAERGWAPEGRYQVRLKLENAEWINPRTGRRYSSEDPENPIGEHWIGLRRLDGDEGAEALPIGIHGTPDAALVGRRAPGGYVRLAPKDIELLFAMLAEGQSRVAVKP